LLILNGEGFHERPRQHVETLPGSRVNHDPLAKTATMPQLRPAITTGSVGAQHICMAYGVSAPGTSTGARHRADTPTQKPPGDVWDGMRLLRGPVQGTRGRRAGEFVSVPPHVPHIEVNISDAVATFVVAHPSGGPAIIPIEADLSNLAHLRAERQREAAITP
jgi:uncharacterized RmlC-like cupin family protein